LTTARGIPSGNWNTAGARVADAHIKFPVCLVRPGDQRHWSVSYRPQSALLRANDNCLSGAQAPPRMGKRVSRRPWGTRSDYLSSDEVLIEFLGNMSRGGSVASVPAAPLKGASRPRGVWWQLPDAGTAVELADPRVYRNSV